jgi:hypothetical protein
MLLPRQADLVSFSLVEDISTPGVGFPLCTRRQTTPFGSLTTICHRPRREVQRTTARTFGRMPFAEPCE